MKKFFIFIIINIVLLRGFAQPTIISPSFPNTVGLFDLFEISFKMGTAYTNPYDPNTILVYAMFYGPNNEIYKIDAFFYEDYSFQKVAGYEHATPHIMNNGWRIRFTPTSIGSWEFRIFAEDASGITAQMPNDSLGNYTFTCTSVDNAEGMITKANSRFLKRDIVVGGVRQFHSFFPIGPNIAWYGCKDNLFEQPYGIYEYEKYIDSLANRANYMRIWLNRSQCLSLYGFEYTQKDLYGNHILYFNNTVNQKDSAELDYIIDYAFQHGVAVMPCIFNQRDFKNKNPLDPSDSSKWANNPFHTILGLDNPCEFFTDNNAKAITKNLIRYIVSRWGYATNIVAWELWNEVDLVIEMCEGCKHIEQDITDWHEEMLDYLRILDPYNRCISTSIASIDNQYLYSMLYDQFDFVQWHRYGNIQNAESRQQLLYLLYKTFVIGHPSYPSKPFFIGEFGFDQGGSHPVCALKDPWGIDLHNSLWSSLFFSSMGTASFWWWPYVDSCKLYNHFAPIFNFCQNLPIPSGSFTTYHTGEVVGHQLEFPNNLQTYYMINGSQDTIYGWVQDTVFAYQSLRWLTDSVQVDTISGNPRLFFKTSGVFDPSGYVYTLNPAKKPQPSTNSNTITIPITNQPVGNIYTVRWYDTETGNLLNTGTINNASVQQDSHGNKYVSFQFPSIIRDLQQHTFNNKFGDAIFVMTIEYFPLKM